MAKQSKSKTYQGGHFVLTSAKILAQNKERKQRLSEEQINMRDTRRSIEAIHDRREIEAYFAL